MHILPYLITLTPQWSHLMMISFCWPLPLLQQISPPLHWPHPRNHQSPAYVSGGEQLGGELWAGQLWLQFCLLSPGLPPLPPPHSPRTQLGTLPVTVTVIVTVLMQVPAIFVPEKVPVPWTYVPDKASFQYARKSSWTNVTLQQLQEPVQQTISLTSQKEQMMNNSVLATNASASASTLQCWGSTLWKLPTNRQDC